MAEFDPRRETGGTPTKKKRDEGGGGYSSSDEKNVALRADRTTREPTVRTPYGVQSAPDYYNTLASVEAHTNHKLPTDVTAYLAGLQGSHKSIIRAAQVINTRFDIDPKYIFGSSNPKDFVNPVTGQRLSLKDAQRLTDNFGPVATVGMIRTAIAAREADLNAGNVAQQEGYKGRVRTGPAERVRIDPSKVARWARKLSQNLPDLKLEDGIGLAVWLASRPDIAEKPFLANLADAQHFLAYAPGENNLKPGTVVSVAIQATSEKKKVTDILLPGVAEKSETLQANIKAVQAHYGSTTGQYSAEAITRNYQQAAVNTGEIIPSAKGQIGTDYWREVQAVSTQVALDQDAFHHSVFGKFLAGVGAIGAGLWKGTERGLVELGFGIEMPVTAFLAPTTGQDPRDVLHYMQGLRSEEITRLNAGEDVGDWVEEGYSNVTEKYAGFRLPGFTSTAFDFAVGWYVDPTVILGKAGRVLRGTEAVIGEGKAFSIAGKDFGIVKEGYSLPTRILPTLETPTIGRTLLEQIPGIGKVLATETKTTNALLERGFQRYVTEVLPKSRVADKLYGALYKGATDYRRALDLYTPGRNLSRTLDYEYMTLLRSKILERYPTLGAAARSEFDDALRAHFAPTGAPKGSVAEWVVNARTNRASGELQKALDNGIIDPDSQLAQDMAERLANGGENAIPFTLEGPATFGAYGPRSLYRRGVTSERFTATPFGKRAAQLNNIDPGRVMNVHEADDYMVLHTRRWGAFDEDYVRKAQGQVIEAQARGYWMFKNPNGTIAKFGYEDGLDKFMNRVNEDAIDYILRDQKYLDPLVVAKVKRKILEPIQQANTKSQTFWVLPEGEGGERLVNTVMAETQRVNMMFVVDPVTVRKELRELTTLPRRMQNHLSKAFDQIPEPQVTGFVERNAFDKALVGLGDTIEGIWDVRKRFWKGLTVARPGYIPRVILLDENARFMFTTRSLFERLAAQEWFGLTRKVSERGIGSKTLDLGEETKTLPLPGAYDRNPSAVGNIRQAEQIEEIMKRGQEAFSRYTPTGSWGAVRATGEGSDEVAHLISWRWALEKQIRGSAPGQVALETVERGGGVDEIRAALKDWAARDHYVVLNKRIGVGPEDFDSWFNDFSQGVYAYTLGDKRIAEAALRQNGKDLEAVLDTVPVGKRPVVHGPGMEALTQGGGYTWGNDFVNWMYKWNVRKPEATLNRHPYYKAMKRRAESAYYQHLEANVDQLKLAKVTPDSRAFVESRINTSLALEEEAYATKSLRAAQTLGGKGDDLGNGVFKLARPDGKTYYYAMHEGDVTAFRTVFKDGRVETIVDPGLRGQGIGSDLLEAHWRDAGVFDATDPLGAAKQLIDKQQFTRSGAELNIKALKKLEPEATTGISPGVHHAVDVASTNFALEQVRRVMFDLTRQSRFTELLQIVFPFPQPFFEGFQTWAAIATRHPETIGRTMQLFRTGVETGFIRKDETTGEYVVPMGIYRAAYTPLWAIGSHLGVNLPNPKLLDELGVGYVAPLASFNLLASSTVKFGASGFMGKMVGGVPIPVPGMDPAIALLGQHLFADTKSQPITSYLFQYGPSSGLTLIPTPVKGMLTALGADNFIPDAQREALRYSILRTYQVEGLDKDANGNPIPLPELQAMAEQQADELLSVRSLMSLFSPASLRTKLAASPYEAEWQDLIESSPDYTSAIDAWIARHPDLSYVTIGKTFYDAGIKGPTGEDLEAPRLPASAVVDQLMNTPGIGDFMKANPAWAGLVLIGLDPAVVEAQDFGVYSKQITQGLMKYKPIDEYLAAGENVKVMKELDDWYTNVWDPARSNITDTSSPAYRDLATKRAEELAILATKYPNWATTHLIADPDPQGGVVYRFPEGGDRPYSLAVAQARRIAATPGFQNAPGFQALGDYLDVRDKVAQQMQNKGITDIMYPSDDADKLRAKLGTEVARIEQTTPGISQFLGAYFGLRVTDTGEVEYTGDLRSVPNQYIKAIAKLPEDVRDGVVNTMSRYQKMRSDADRSYNYAWEKSQNYQDSANFFDSKWLNNREVVQTWWSKYMKPSERQEYKANLATKPSVFYSAWDWHVSGVNLNEKQVNRLEQIAEWRIGIQKGELEAAQQGTEFDTGAHYERIDAQVADWAKKDKKFASLVDNMNTWTYGLRAAGYGDHPNKDKTNYQWWWVMDAADKIQANIDTYNHGRDTGSQLHGFSTFVSKEDAHSYQAQRDWLVSWVNYFKDQNPAFRQSWNDVQEQNQDPIIGDIILPDVYYRLGGS